jgi:MscS family membrane protein
MKSRSSPLTLFCALLLLPALFATAAWPQNASVPATAKAGAPAAEVKPEKDPLGRETPQGMVAGLMKALANANYRRAARFFQTNTVSDAESSSVLSGTDLAKSFQAVLDRAGSVITPAELSDNPNGNINDGLPVEVEKFGVIKTPIREVPLLAKRVKRDDKSLWLVSEGTLSEIPALARVVAVDSSSKLLVDWIPKGPLIGGAPISHWLALLVTAGLSFVFTWALIALRGPLARFVRFRGAATKVSTFVEASAGPLRLLISLLIFGVAIQALGVSVVARYRVLFGAEILVWFAFTWLLWRWVDAAGEMVLERMSRRGELSAYSAVSFFNRLLKVILGLLFIAALLRSFGVNLTAGLAALGIGGLAVALGAQKLLENIIGSLTLIADRPIRIGDFCRFGNKLGTIEEIGIRSTRIRTLDRTVVTVPNGELSSLQIENFAPRDRFWFHPILNLRYETSSDQMRYVLQALRSMLSEHAKVDSESMRVRFIGLGAHSLDVEIFAYVYANDYAGYLEIQEELLLNCMDIVEASGSGFAFPSRTLYFGRDSGLNELRAREAEESIRRQRQEKN